MTDTPKTPEELAIGIYEKVTVHDNLTPSMKVNPNRLTKEIATAITEERERNDKSTLLNDYQAAINARDSVTQDRNELLKEVATLRAELDKAESQKKILLKDLETWKRLCDQVRLPMEEPLQYQKQAQKITDLESRLEKSEAELLLARETRTNCFNRSIALESENVKLREALEGFIESCTVTYESQAKKYLKEEFQGRARVWSDYGCWLYPGDCIYEVDAETIKKAKEALATRQEGGK